jgi:tape measure domain-containing protein
MSAYAIKINIDGNAKEKIADLKAAVDKFGGTISHMNEKVKEGNNSIMDFAKGTFLAGAAMKSLEFAKEGIKSILETGIAAEKTAISYEVLLGSAEKGQEMVKKLKEWSDVTPFKAGTVADAGKTLLNFGASAQSVLPYLKMIGDVSSGDQEKFERLTYSFGEMLSEGKLNGRQVREMINSGFNPLQEIAAMTGKSMAVVKEEMEKGGITADVALKAFQHATSEGGRFFGMMKKQSGTVGGLWSTAMSRMEEIFVKIFNKIKPILTTIITKIIDVGTAINSWLESEGFTKFYEGIKNIVKAFAPVFDMFKQIYDIIAHSFSGLKNIKFDQIIASVKHIINWLKPFFALVVSLFKAIWEGIGNLLNGLSQFIEPLVRLFNYLKPALLFIFKLLIDVITFLFKFFAGVVDVLHTIYVFLDKIKLFTVLSFIFQMLWDVIKGVGEALVWIYNHTLKPIFDGIGWVYDKIKGLLGIAGNDINVSGKLNFPNIPNLPDNKNKDDDSKLQKIGDGELGQSAINTSALGGASGGLGEAKVIKIDFHKALMEVNVPGGNGTDIIGKGQLTVEAMLRIINNLSMAQGATM